MRIYIGADHRGFDHASVLTQGLIKAGFDAHNVTPATYDPQDDYPDIAHTVATHVVQDARNLGVLICGSGGGVCIAANKHQGIYAALAIHPEQAISAREDDHANILCLAANHSTPEEMLTLSLAYLGTTPQVGRHLRRLQKVHQIERGLPLQTVTKPAGHRQIAPSLLSSDLGSINQEIARLTPYVDRFHVDIMDGHFVPNLTFGVPVLRKIQSLLPLDAHLMVEYPERYIQDVATHCDIVYIHIDAPTTKSVPELIQMIRQAGSRAGLTMRPTTPRQVIEEHLAEADALLYMTVMPGKSGQSMLMETIPLLADLSAKHPSLHICVDGGINAQTVGSLAGIRIDCLVSGAYLFGAPDPAQALTPLWLSR